MNFLWRLIHLLHRRERHERLVGRGETGDHGAPAGLILVQIDGLSRKVLEKALRERRMPFCARLLGSGRWRLTSHYAGLPSSTPAVQGELFYGKRCTVPAFGFRDRDTGRYTSLFDTHTARKFEKELSDETSDPLLDGGSAYGDVYSGGASRCGYSMVKPGPPGLSAWSGFPRMFRFVWMVAATAVKLVPLMIIETMLALVDVLRGVIHRQDPGKEIKFILSRLAICLVMREVIRGRVQEDIRDNLPIIHVNFLGYDEQAHRRGPFSRFAGWTLKGIDRAIERIWQTAQSVPGRSYDLWIYSDHGQEQVTPYHVAHRAPLCDRVASVLVAAGREGWEVREFPNPVGGLRYRLLGSRIRRLSYAFNHGESRPTVGLTGMGPVYHLYLPEPLPDEKKEQIEHLLVQQAGIPAVLGKDTQGRVWITTGSGRRLLAEGIDAFLGDDHPFKEEVFPDLERLVNNRHAGDIVLMGYRWAGLPETFAAENGSHAGPGRVETGGFALLSNPIPAPWEGQPFIRPHDLRQMVLTRLGRRELSTVSRRRLCTRRVIRVMTWNVHACIGRDGKADPSRIARVIETWSPDLVALQELDRGRGRTDAVDQAARIAATIDMDFHFHPTYILEEGDYGNALFAAAGPQVVKKGALPALRRSEPRGVLWARISIAGRTINCLVTHLGLSPRERKLQSRALSGHNWLGSRACGNDVLLCGDFNCVPGGLPVQTIRKRLDDVADGRSDGLRSWMGLIRLDYIFASPTFIPRAVFVPNTELTRMASDHLPLIADLEVT